MRYPQQLNLALIIGGKTIDCDGLFRSSGGVATRSLRPKKRAHDEC